MKRWLTLILLVALIVTGLVVSQMSKMDRGVRSIAFIVLGVLLLVVSFLYKRERGRQNL